MPAPPGAVATPDDTRGSLSGWNGEHEEERSLPTSPNVVQRQELAASRQEPLVEGEEGDETGSDGAAIAEAGGEAFPETGDAQAEASAAGEVAQGEESRAVDTADAGFDPAEAAATEGQAEGGGEGLDVQVSSMGLEPQEPWPPSAGLPKEDSSTAGGEADGGEQEGPGAEEMTEEAGDAKPSSSRPGSAASATSQKQQQQQQPAKGGRSSGAAPAVHAPAGSPGGRGAGRLGSIGVQGRSALAGAQSPPSRSKSIAVHNVGMGLPHADPMVRPEDVLRTSPGLKRALTQASREASMAGSAGGPSFHREVSTASSGSTALMMAQRSLQPSQGSPLGSLRTAKQSPMPWPSALGPQGLLGELSPIHTVGYGHKESFALGLEPGEDDSDEDHMKAPSPRDAPPAAFREALAPGGAAGSPSIFSGASPPGSAMSPRWAALQASGMGPGTGLGVKGTGGSVAVSPALAKLLHQAGSIPKSPARGSLGGASTLRAGLLQGGPPVPGAAAQGGASSSRPGSVPTAEPQPQQQGRVRSAGSREADSRGSMKVAGGGDDLDLSQAPSSAPYRPIRSAEEESMVPTGLEHMDLHVPMHLLDSSYYDGPHSPWPQSSMASFATTPHGQNTYRGPGPPKPGMPPPPPKAPPAGAMPFMERNAPVAARKGAPPGAGSGARGHGSSGPPSTGPPSGQGKRDASQPQDQRRTGSGGGRGPSADSATAGQRGTASAGSTARRGMGSGGVLPVTTEGTELLGMMTVKAVMRGEQVALVEQPTGLAPKPKRSGPGRLNFRSLRPLPAINAGVTGLSVDKVKEGLERRMLAADMQAYGPPAFQRKFEPRPETPPGVKLDGFMLLAAGDDELPEGIAAAKLASRGINDVETVDLAYFGALAVLDLADNRMPGMELLSTLPAIRALSLSLNRMTSPGSFDPTAVFLQLETLDLSYNKLDAMATVGPDSPIGHLPKLRELNLSGNSWKALPHVLAPFEALELLKLASNHLTGAALAPLSHLPCLTSLSLSRNAVEGVAGVTGYEASVEEALAGGGIDAASAFPCLETLDLSYCRVTSHASVQPLRALPRLTRLLLAGNPLASAEVQAAKRAAQKRAKAAIAAADGAILAPGALTAPPHDPLLVFEPVAAQGPRPTVASVLGGRGGRFRHISEPLGRREAAGAANLAAVVAVPEEAVGEAFERADAAIEAWQLNTVPEEEEEEEEEDDGEPVEDNTFLTGVGITEKIGKGQKQQLLEEAEAAAAEANKRASEAEAPDWQDVEDPTERLALALGLDPRRLAIYTGLPTTDALGAINALRFALAHPLVEADEGVSAPAHHLNLTVAAKAKRRGRAGAKLVPLGGAASAAAAAAGKGIGIPPDGRAIKIQTVEGMLEGMRARLAALEGTLASRLASLPAGAIADAAAAAPAGEASGVTGDASSPMYSLEQDFAELERDSPGSPERRESMAGGNGEFRPRTMGVLDDDAVSQMSSLPDDVIDAIENSDQGDSSSGEDEDDVTPGGTGGDRSAANTTPEAGATSGNGFPMGRRSGTGVGPSPEQEASGMSGSASKSRVASPTGRAKSARMGSARGGPPRAGSPDASTHGRSMAGAGAVSASPGRAMNTQKSRVG